jgi:hypothetical protein
VGRRRRPCRWPLGTYVGAPQVAPGRAKGTYERSWLAGGACAPLAPISTPGIDRPRAPLPYVANVCFKCFKCFGGMLQVFHMDIVKVNWDVAYVVSVCSKCFIYFERMV